MSWKKKKKKKRQLQGSNVHNWQIANKHEAKSTFKARWKRMLILTQKQQIRMALYADIMLNTLNWVWHAYIHEIQVLMIYMFTGFPDTVFSSWCLKPISVVQDFSAPTGSYPRLMWHILVNPFTALLVNPFTAPACTISMLKSAHTHTPE